MSKTWILVAESSRARFFEQETPIADLKELPGLSHTESRQHESELTSDKPGHSFDGKGQGSHALGQKTSPKEAETIAFSKNIVEFVEKERTNGGFEGLVIIAPPDFLGLIRKGLSEATKKLVEGEIAKNLIHQSAEEIKGYLPKDFLGH